MAWASMRHELVHVHTLVSQAPVKRFNEVILHRLAWSNEVELDDSAIRPILPGTRLKIRPMIEQGTAGILNTRSSTRPTVSAIIRNPISKIGLCRHQLSATVKIRNATQLSSVSVAYASECLPILAHTLGTPKLKAGMLHCSKNWQRNTPHVTLAQSPPTNRYS